MFGPEPRGRFGPGHIHSLPPAGSPPSLSWEILDNVDRKRAKLSFVASSKGAHQVGFDTPRQGYNEMFIGMVPPQAGIQPEKYLYSEARLDGIVIVSLCSGIVRGKKAVIGLMFMYDNGDRACVGQIRFNAMLSYITVRNHRLCILRSGDDGETVLQVACWPQLWGPPGATWKKLPVKATMQWYFDADEHFVRFRDGVLPYASVGYN